MDPNETSILSAKLLNNIQNGFIDNINSSFGSIQADAIKIMYLLITIELVLFGLAWAIKQDESFGLLIIKILKIAFIVFFINYFPIVLQILVNGFTYEGYHVVSNKASIFLFQPGKIWEIGFKGGVDMLKLSVEYGSLNFGMSMLYLVLGFGTLIIFALIGAQVILVVVSFYVIALVALLFAPFGIFKPMEKFFYQSVHVVFKAGARVFALIIVLGVAFALWKTMKVTSVSTGTTLEKPLTLFFTSVVLLVIIWKLPSLVADAVGKIGGNIFAGMGQPASATVIASSSSGVSPYIPGVSQVSDATSVSATPGAIVGSGVASVAQGASMVSSGSSAPTSGMASGATVSVSTANASMLDKGGKVSKVGDASSINRSISSSTLNKLKEQ